MAPVKSLKNERCLPTQKVNTFIVALRIKQFPRNSHIHDDQTIQLCQILKESKMHAMRWS